MVELVDWLKELSKTKIAEVVDGEVELVDIEVEE